MPATKIQRREFLQLADTYEAAKHKVGGFYISEKLDGTRCFWDGGITRGLKTEDVPWASLTHPKLGGRKDKIKPFSTGLWSRYGNPIMAPDWFLNQLPCCPLDGELWAGRENFQECRSICAGDEPDERFNKISYAVYSSPSFGSVFANGLIKNSNMHVEIVLSDIERFVRNRLPRFKGDFKYCPAGSTFDQELLFLREAIETQNDHVFLHRQTKLPADHEAAAVVVEETLNKLLEERAEGVVIRDPAAKWIPKRHKGLLKFKPYEDAEAVVIGYRAGKVGKQGNVLGKIGTLQVRTISLRDNVEFEIGSGLTFEDREFSTDAERLYAHEHPGEQMPDKTSGKVYPRGCTLTFKYRELSDDGVPKEARAWRRRDGGCEHMHGRG